MAAGYKNMRKIIENKTYNQKRKNSAMARLIKTLRENLDFSQIYKPRKSTAAALKMVEMCQEHQ